MKKLVLGLNKIGALAAKDFADLLTLFRVSKFCAFHKCNLQNFQRYEVRYFFVEFRSLLYIIFFIM